MGRKREPDHDWVCRRCGCPCVMPGTTRTGKHVGGGQGMRACNQAEPVLRRDLEHEAQQVVAGLRNRIRLRPEEQ
jgi:hypothetical protein